MTRNGARRYLSLRGRKWWFKRDIPAEIRDALGRRTAYLVNLETSDLRAAMGRRDELRTETDRLFASARAGNLITTAADHIRDLGELWAKELRESRANPHLWTARITGREIADVTDEEANTADGFIEEEGERIGREHGAAARERFMGIAHGHVDVDHHLEAYLKEAGLAPKTVNERRGLVGRFAKWARSENLVMRDVTRAVAGRYFGAHIAPLHRRTAAKHLTAITQYWDYLVRRGCVTGENPWVGQAQPQKGRRANRGDQVRERDFTTDEIRVLLYPAEQAGQRKDVPDPMPDAMRIAALSGMRLAEIVNMQAGDVEWDADGAGWFALKEGKTRAAARRVPIHPDLVAIIQRRVRGRSGSATLFPELDRLPNAADALGKRFASYRKRLGVDDPSDGRRRSLVNFHSFRRWFVTQAGLAGQQEVVVGAVVGHAEGRRTITFGTYFGQSPEAAMRQCVEAVKLPPDPATDAAAAPY
jgi:integrase